MHDPTQRAILVKAVIAAALIGAAWIFTVKPARADLNDRHEQLRIHDEASALFDQQPAEQMRSETVLANLNAHAHALREALTAFPSTAVVFEHIENTASKTGVQVLHTDPRATGRRIEKLTGREAQHTLLADDIMIEFTGGYDAMTAFVSSIQNARGSVHISELRVFQAHAQPLSGSLTMTVYRAPAGTNPIPQFTEDADED